MTGIAWELLIGLGIFLYGMSRLEAGLRDISNVSLKRWLMQFTSTPVSSASFGVAITTLLQSSSMVSLLVLAFASAGIIPLYNGIGVLLGANVGTTATGWLVATIGFKLDLEGMAIPLFGLGCLSQILLTRASRAHAFGKLVLGLGLLLYGLSLMKTSVSGLPASWDVSLLHGHPALVYLLVGILVTAIIQSSSATMMLTLTALHAQLIGLPEAAALVIGADIGTTSTTVLGSLTGSAIKKRLALAHLVFNLTVDIAAFVLLLPLLPQLLAMLTITDPLYSLVAFHSSFNLLGLLCFLPFLKPFSRWISRWFTEAEQQRSVIENMPTDVPEAALSAMKSQVRMLWLYALANNLKHFRLTSAQVLPEGVSETALHGAVQDADGSWKDRYELIKDREDELLRFALRLQQQPLGEDQAQLMTGLLEMTRALVYTSKTLKDIHKNLSRLRDSSNPAAAELFRLQRQFHRDFYTQLLSLMLEQHGLDYLREETDALLQTNDRHHHAMDARVYASAAPADQRELVDDNDTQLSTQLNVNREIHHANKSLLKSLTIWFGLQPLQPGLANAPQLSGQLR